jgi:hypothetical protein
MKERRLSRDFLNMFDFISCLVVQTVSLLWSHFNPYGLKYTIWVCQVKMKTKPLTSAQIRAARALLRWSAEDLAQNSALGINTIRRAELAVGETSMTAANNLAVRRALEAAGVEFIDEDGGGPGVRLRKGSKHKSRK